MTLQVNFSYDLLASGDEQAAADLVKETFLSQVAPLYATEGVNEFMSQVSAQAIGQRLQAKDFILAAYGPEGLTGIIEVDSHRGHIVWFFVRQDAQGLGVGRELLARALAEQKNRNPDIAKVTVNSSPNSADAYRTLGFFATDYQQERNGIIFTPMVLHLA
jgi:GNAT superfamily N-acetyltransferase